MDGELGRPADHEGHRDVVIQGSSFRGALLRESGIHAHGGEHGFRLREEAHPGMTVIIVKSQTPQTEML
jgi:hypothetical protein